MDPLPIFEFRLVLVENFRRGRVEWLRIVFNSSAAWIFEYDEIKLLVNPMNYWLFYLDNILLEMNGIFDDAGIFILNHFSIFWLA